MVLPTTFRGTSIWSVDIGPAWHVPLPPENERTSPKRRGCFNRKSIPTHRQGSNFQNRSDWYMDLDLEGWHFEIYHAISCLGAILHALNLRHFCLNRCWERGVLNRSSGRESPLRQKSKYQGFWRKPRLHDGSWRFTFTMHQIVVWETDIFWQRDSWESLGGGRSASLGFDHNNHATMTRIQRLCCFTCFTAPLQTESLFQAFYQHWFIIILSWLSWRMCNTRSRFLVIEWLLNSYPREIFIWMSVSAQDVH